MQVIGAGLPRCATSSLQAALESPILGMGPCMHMAHVFPHTEIGSLVIQALKEENRERRHKLLYRLFDGYASTCDFPGIMFIDDLMDMYPDAAVILNQRKSAKVWDDSVRNPLEWFESWSYWAVCLLWKTDRVHYQLHQTANAVQFRRFGEPKFRGESLYHKYNEWVRAEAKKRGRAVLEFQPEMGYPTLCEFLGKEKPREPVAFPHLNEAKNVRILKAILVTRGLLAWAALGASLWAGWKYGPELLGTGFEIVRARLG
ncbi:hypothetical protein GQ53DRAFT_636594 [Thozetella sp. PMI_491]|nr:hypothetical protein GQ53DRAFT_636594 [Thozetella sp. PMI_491]